MNERVKAISEVLFESWDPIGVSTIPEFAGEYDEYAAAIDAMIAKGSNAAELEAFLSSVLTGDLGLDLRTMPKAKIAVDRILNLPRG
jgi:hypothetical protein